MADALSGRLDRVVDTILARGDATGAVTDTELAPLARLAAELRHYPSPTFTARLRATLKERATMTTMLTTAAPTTTRAREGFTTITPYVNAKDSSFTDFVKQVFNAVETDTTTTPRGVHRELRIGDSMLMVGESADEGEGRPRRSAVWRAVRVRAGRHGQLLVHLAQPARPGDSGRAADAHGV